MRQKWCCHLKRSPIPSENQCDDPFYFDPLLENNQRVWAGLPSLCRPSFYIVYLSLFAVFFLFVVFFFCSQVCFPDVPPFCLTMFPRVFRCFSFYFPLCSPFILTVPLYLPLFFCFCFRISFVHPLSPFHCLMLPYFACFSSVTLFHLFFLCPFFSFSLYFPHSVALFPFFPFLPLFLLPLFSAQVVYPPRVMKTGPPSSRSRLSRWDRTTTGAGKTKQMDHGGRCLGASGSALLREVVHVACGVW